MRFLSALAFLKAIQAAERSVAIDPEYGPARVLLALLCPPRTSHSELLSRPSRLRKIEPNDDGALDHKIMARRRLGQTDKIQALVKQLAVMRSENAQKERASRSYVLQEEPDS